MGKRPVTLCTCQWADLPFDELCAPYCDQVFDSLLDVIGWISD